MADFPAAQAHGELREVFPDIFFVSGAMKMNVLFTFSRNMTVLREGEDLYLINSVRLDEAGLARLEALGRVKAVIKLGSFHGIDDPFYLDRYGAEFWPMQGQRHEHGIAPTRELSAASELPIRGASIFAFSTPKKPEGLLVLDREGGIVISCDALQNWAKADRYFNLPSRLLMPVLGFIKPANIGPGWIKGANPPASDFAAVKKLSFRHLLPAHGEPIKESARDQLATRIAQLFKV